MANKHRGRRIGLFMLPKRRGIGFTRKASTKRKGGQVAKRIANEARQEKNFAVKKFHKAYKEMINVRQTRGQNGTAY